MVDPSPTSSEPQPVSAASIAALVFAAMVLVAGVVVYLVLP